MTNEEMIQDLKQFITATVSQAASQSEERISTRLRSIETRLDGVDGRLSDLDTKVDIIHDAIADTFAHSTEERDRSDLSMLPS